MTPDTPPPPSESDFPLEQVTIVGVGLLGGSLGLALRRRGLARRVVGLGRSAERLAEARALGCLDAFETDAARALEAARLVVLCQPVSVIVDFLPTCFSLIPPGAIVTDVGSTKASIVEAGEAAAAQRGDSTAFVGSHPMAGSERSGAAWAEADLFEGATCHVTITPRTPSPAAARVAELWRRVGARIILDAPERHDRMVAAVSHVPHMVAVALVQSLDSVDGHPEFQQRLLGPGFRDMTRVAMGSADMWTDICRENRMAISTQLRELIRLLEDWDRRLAEGNCAEARRILETAAQRRTELYQTKSRENRGDAESG